MGTMTSEITSITMFIQPSIQVQKKTSKLCVTGICVGNSQVTSEFPAQRATNAGDFFFIWLRHHATLPK